MSREHASVMEPCTLCRPFPSLWDSKTFVSISRKSGVSLSGGKISAACTTNAVRNGLSEACLDDGGRAFGNGLFGRERLQAGAQKRRPGVNHGLGGAVLRGGTAAVEIGGRAEDAAPDVDHTHRQQAEENEAPV